MSSKNIFQQTHAPRTSRLVPMFDGAMTSAHSNLAIGRVCGDHREVMAVVSPTATDDDVWRVVNLKSKGGDTDQFDSIAVLGAIDDDQAVEWAFNQRGRFLLDSVTLSVGETNTRGLKRYLDSERLNYRENSPIHLNQLAKLQDMTTGQPVLWDGINLKSHSNSPAVLLVDLVKHDDHSQLFDAIKADDMPALLELLGAEAMGYDALIVESRKLDTLMQRLGAAMSKATEAGVTVTNVRQSEPFKRNKVTQVAAIFEMSDGQSVSIVFHNPDSTPSKLLPQDTLISWKFLLNSRDISAAVQPNQGEDVQLPVLATRMMKLVNQNSARFARTNAKKAENVAALDEAKARIETKSQTVAALDAEIAQLQAELDKPVVVVPTVEPQSEPDDITQAEADDWNAGDEMPHQGEYQEYNGETIKYVITKPRRNAKGVLIVADKRKAGGWTRIWQLCQAKGINGRWSGVQNGYIISSEKKVEKLIDLLNTGWSASTVTGDLFAPKNTAPAPQPTPAVEPEPQLSTRAEVFKILTSDYGWSESRISGGIEKEFSGMAAAGEMSNGVRILSANFDSKERWIAVSDNAAPTGGAIIPSTEIDARIGGYTPDGFIITAKAFNDAVEAYVQTEREKVVDNTKPAPAVEPTTPTTDLGNNEPAIGMTNNGDGTFTAMTATQRKIFKTRAGAVRWLAQRGLNPDGSRIASGAPDLEYRTSGMFTSFVPNTPEGEQAWREMAVSMQAAWKEAYPDLDAAADAKVPTYNLKQVIRALEDAGYTVEEAAAPVAATPEEDDALLANLGLDPAPAVKPDPTAAMRAGKMQAHLNQSIQTTDGNVTTIGKLIDLRISQGGRPVEKSKRDPAAEKRLMTEFEALARNAPIGNSNHPDTIRLNELKAMKKDPSKFKYGEFVVTVPSYFLEGKDGEPSMVLTKTGFDYAKSVVANMPAPAPTPEEAPMPATNPNDAALNYIKSVIDGSLKADTLDSIKDLNDQLARISKAQMTNPDGRLEGLLTRAIDIAIKAKPSRSATNPDAEYLQSIVDGANQGTDKESRAKVREIVTNARAAANAEIEALATTAVNQIAARMKAAAQAKLAEVA